MDISLDTVNPQSLERQALLDLAQRAKRGTYVYLPTWLLLAAWGDLPAHAPTFFGSTPALPPASQWYGSSCIRASQIC